MVRSASRVGWSIAARGVIVLMLLLGLVSCSDDEGSSSSPDGSATSAAGLPQPEVTSIKIGVAALEPSVFLPQLALDAGLFEKYGFSDVEVTYFEGASRALQAGVSGQVDAVADSPQITLISMATENPLQDVAIFTNKFLDCIVASGDIETPEDLLGKRVAVSSLGGQSHSEVIVAFKEFGISTEEVEVTIVGDQTARIAALQAGSVDAIPVDCALENDLKADGFNVLLRLPDIETQLAGGNLTLQRDFIEANPNTVLALVAAHLEAMQVLFEDTERAAEYFAAWAQISPEDALLQLESYKLVAQRDLRWTDEGYQNVQDVVSIVNPVVAAVDITLANNPSFLDKLEELGLNESLGL